MSTSEQDVLPKKRTRTKPQPDNSGYQSSIEQGDREERIIQRYKERIRNRGTAIRAFCIECMGGQIAEVKRCGVQACPLFPYRMGTNPFSRRSKRIQAGQESQPD